MTTKSASKYKYAVCKTSIIYNPFFEGTWRAENIDGMPDYVRLSSSERTDDGNSYSYSKKTVTIPKARLLSEFAKVKVQDIQPEFKEPTVCNHEKEPESGCCHDLWDEFTAPNAILECNKKGDDQIWTNGEIESFMSTFDFPPSMLWTDDEIREFSKRRKVESKKSQCASRECPRGRQSRNGCECLNYDGKCHATAYPTYPPTYDDCVCGANAVPAESSGKPDDVASLLQIASDILAKASRLLSV